MKDSQGHLILFHQLHQFVRFTIETNDDEFCFGKFVGEELQTRQPTATRTSTIGKEL